MKTCLKFTAFLHYTAVVPFLLFMITPAQVRHIAKLARLGLQEADIEKFSKQLSNIFAYIEKLNEVDTSSVAPTAQVTGLNNVMREDKEERFCDREELLACSELEKEKDQIKVRSAITF